MTYENLETQGTIRQVFLPQYVTKDNQPQLVSPDQIYFTRVIIDKGKRCSTSTELFGEFGPDCVGRQIRLVESYDQPEAGLKRLTQQVFIDSKLEVDQAVIMRV
ncbi:MAG TPA: hypothetical protein VJG49_02575 [Candidatus Nanoarchaeia archaeon]|nr:hypothetical protein [Candidatus Nanoarchaeia archaeon]